ncbi:MAG: DUF3298 and DUF4163 domain-containing protein [Lachnospiraceae bacterium]|nr:DUF3298 and DUF4163 domain-containing protein [Lachnospiraceae bacterium]
MKYRKIFIGLVLSCALLTGCAGSADQDISVEEATETETEEFPAGESAQEQLSETSQEESVSGNAAPRVEIETAYWKWGEDDAAWRVYAENDSISVSGDSYEALGEAVAGWNEEQTEAFRESCEELAVYAAEDAAYVDPDADSLFYYDAWREAELCRVDETVFSLTILSYAYTGGAHGNSGYTGVSFDSQSGEILTLSDILADEEGFQRAAQQWIVEKLAADHGDELFEDYAETVAAMWEAEPDWYLDAEGITFVFDPNEVGPYAMGAAFVSCPYAEFAVYMKADYVRMNGTGVGRFSVNTDVETEAGTLRIDMPVDEDYGMAAVSLGLNGEVLEAGEFGSFGDAYLLHLSDGRSFVLFDVDYASDDYVSFLCEITDGSPVLRSRLEGVSLQGGTVGAEVQTLRVHLDVLGSYDAYMDYVIGENGELMQTEEVFEIRSDNQPFRILTVTRELPVTADGQAAVLPVGTRIRITGSDNAGTAYYRDEDSGGKGMISYVCGDGEDAWELYIDGVSEYEYFETIPYAG